MGLKARVNEKATPAKTGFGYFGQGDASYFEWFEMWIWFEKPVPKSARAEILKLAPKLCAMDAEWPHPNLLWASTGDQWIHQHLIEEYGTKEAWKTMQRIMVYQEESGDRWGTGDEDEDGMFAGSKEHKQFNADIETWLLASNELQPILFAARREDGEAGGTQLGDWHQDSVAKFQTAVRPYIEAVTSETKKQQDLRTAPISIALEFVGKDQVSKTLLGWLEDDE